MKFALKSVLFAAVAVMFIPASATANDSEAEIAIGGLVLKQNDAIRLDSEDLYISADKVIVKYRFTNTSDVDVETLVSFPLPPQPDRYPDGMLSDMASDWSGLNFVTKVNGEEVPLQIMQQAEAKGRPIDDVLTARGWPRFWYEDDALLNKIAALTPYELADLERQGVLMFNREYSAYFPNWQVVTHVTRTQIFPAGATISVEHSYVPDTGGSVGGSLYPTTRQEMPEVLNEYKAAYCVDDQFLAGFDKRVLAANEEERWGFSETWIGYVLKSGANWSGPIADFRLVVDKGQPGNLVSFCMDGDVTKISPTQFEVRRTNFEPTRDLDILILNTAPYKGE
jgi:Domain of unknown function (DUF4424)